MLEETAIDTEEPSIISFREVNQPFLLETGECSRVTGTFLRTSSSSSVFDSMQMTDYQSLMIQKEPDINQLQLSNNSSFSNASDAAMNEIKTAFCFSNDDTLKSFDPKSAGCSNLAVMVRMEAFFLKQIFLIFIIFAVRSFSCINIDRRRS